MIKVLIADDHTVVREGLKKIIEEASEVDTVAEVDNGLEALENLRKHDYDVVILDISMPGRNGIEVLKDIKELKPSLPVLILSMYPEDQFALRAIKAGASGYLTKKSASRDIRTAIREVYQGRKYISPELAQQMAYEFDESGHLPLHHQLSDREFEVMRLLASGKQVSDIAEELSLSVQSISTYRSRILEKMNMKNNAELMYYAIKNNLVD